MVIEDLGFKDRKISHFIVIVFKIQGNLEVYDINVLVFDLSIKDF